MKRSPRSSRGSGTSAGLALVLVLCTVASARAQEDGSLLLEHNGQKGMWFPMATARAMLADVTALPKIKATLDLMERRLGLERERTMLLERSVATTEQIAVKWKETAEAQAKILTTDRTWWRSRVLWSIVGFVLGSGMTVGIVAAVKRL